MKTEKWFRYKIDYEYGTAYLWAKDRLKEPLDKFYNLASECFGIRKSIGKTRLLDEELLPIKEDVSTPKSTGEQVMKQGCGDYSATMLHAMLNTENTEKIDLSKAHYVLAHSGGDVIVFTKRGKKLKSEWD